MPIYEYEVCEGGCKVCGGQFTLHRPISAPPLKECPVCRKTVRKVFSVFNSPNLGVSISKANDAGFTVLKRISKGEYQVHKPKKGV